MEDNLIDMVFEDSISGYVDDIPDDMNYGEPDESMDGDFDSAMASAGLGTTEDYEHNLFDDNGME